MRRLTVVQLLPALDAGGVERGTLEIARALVAAGHRSIVISRGGRLVPQLLAEGSEHLALPIGAKSFALLPALWRLRAALRRIAPDIVHARSRLPAWLGRLACASLPAARRPHWITTVHGLNSPGRYSRVLCTGRPVICVSDTVRRYLLAHYPDLDPGRLRVVPRGVDPAQFPRGLQPDAAWRAAFFADWPQLDGGLLLTLPGRGTRLKGHADAISLLAALRGEGLDARLLLLGADEPGRAAYLDALRAQAEALGVRPWLAISPPRADVAAVYAVSALVLQLSRKPEAFGRTVLEALRIGTPVLGWDAGGVGELLGALYPEGRVAPEDRAALHARARLLLRAPPPVAPVQGYTLAAMQDATLALYAEVAGAIRG